MSIIAKVGRRKFSTRALLAGIYAALIAGGITMLYPFLLMLATSTTGEPDTKEFRVIPRFWFDRGALYQRFLYEKYQSVSEYAATHDGDASRVWADIELPTESVAEATAKSQAWREFVGTLKPEEFGLWYVGRRNMPGKAEMLWRDSLRAAYASPADLGRDFHRDVTAFTEAFAPYERPQGRLWPGVAGAEGQRWDAFKASIDGKFRRPVDGTALWRAYLNFKYEKVDALNRAIGLVPSDAVEATPREGASDGPPASTDDSRLRLRDSASSGAGVGLTPSPGTPGEDGGEGSASKVENHSSLATEPSPSPLPAYQERDRAASATIADVPLNTRSPVDPIAGPAAHSASDRAPFKKITDVPLSTRLPSDGLAADWEHWVRNELGYRFIGIDGGDAKYRDYLLSGAGTSGSRDSTGSAATAGSPVPGGARTAFDSIAQLNARLGTSYASAQAIVWPPVKPTAAELDAIGGFLRTGPGAKDFSVRTPDIRYAELVASTLGANARPPYEDDDVVTFAADASAWRWWAFTRNYAEVIDYIAVRGRSLWNTLFLVGTMVLAAVTVNPLAAYALSRFRLSATNQILTFLLATMAFPGEVTMIPNFLLLRQFPVWSWLIGAIVGGAIFLALRRASFSRRARSPFASSNGEQARRLHESSGFRFLFATVFAILGAIFAGGYLTPLLGSLVGVNLGPISLLNTFPALILPRLANGFSIFLLKGFFDSLPEEVFEAGRIDGAGELRMLWNLAFPMSTPILAVIVLQTFMSTYGSYLWALVVCQDDSMWTLMVHVYQLQQWAPPYVTMAAAVLCSIPTLVVFLLAQNVIMRGVVLPSYK